MTDPLCTCGHMRLAHSSTTGRCLAPNSAHDADCVCRCPCDRYAPPGSLEDILGVWRDQGQFPLRNAQDVKLLVDEIHDLRTTMDEDLKYQRRLERRVSRAEALLSWINGRCVDEAPHMEIRAAIDRYNQEQP